MGATGFVRAVKEAFRVDQFTAGGKELATPNMGCSELPPLLSHMRLSPYIAWRHANTVQPIHAPTADATSTRTPSATPCPRPQEIVINKHQTALCALGQVSPTPTPRTKALSQSQTETENILQVFCVRPRPARTARTRPGTVSTP